MSGIGLFVTDIDNTLFDWVRYYVHAFSALLEAVETETKVPWVILAEEAKQVFVEHGSIEYPFLVQELPSVSKHYGDDIDAMLATVVRSARQRFNVEADRYLVPYEGVSTALGAFRAAHPGVPVVALTDAPRYVAMWKLNKLGLLQHFDAVYGLADPRIPTCENAGRVKVDPEILLKHLRQNAFGFKGRIRILPDDYEKPGTKGLKTVLMDFDMDEDLAHRQRVVWVGDNQRKDVGLGKRLGVKTAWAKYGKPDQSLIPKLHAFSPALNIHKNAALSDAEIEGARPDYVLETFADILAIV